MQTIHQLPLPKTPRLKTATSKYYARRAAAFGSRVCAPNDAEYSHVYLGHTKTRASKKYSGLGLALQNPQQTSRRGASRLASSIVIEFDQKDTAKAKFAPNGEPASKRQKVEHVNEVLMSWQRGEIITTAQATRLAKAFQI
jgi:hypothetical protein